MLHHAIMILTFLRPSTENKYNLHLQLDLSNLSKLIDTQYSYKQQV